jgi:hypothetical protein
MCKKVSRNFPEFPGISGIPGKCVKNVLIFIDFINDLSLKHRKNPEISPRDFGEIPGIPGIPGKFTGFFRRNFFLDFGFFGIFIQHMQTVLH